MCDCKSRIEAQLVERYKAAQPKAADHQATLEGYGFGVVGNTMVMRPCMPIKYGARHPTKAGPERWKSEKGTMVFRFCPFCGEKLAAAAKDGA